MAVILSGYVRWMGFNAQGHVTGASSVNLEQLAIRAGVARAGANLDSNGARLASNGASVLEVPYLTRGFRLGVITTDYALAPDLPLDPNAPAPEDDDIRDGVMGTRPLWWDAKQAERPVHMGRYPMEKIPRADEPSTLILRDEIARIPKRGDFFKRAQAGDLGEKAKRERMRFPMKHPYALGMQPLIQQMVPLQGGREKLQPTGIGGDLTNPQRNADAIKALGYYIGAALLETVGRPLLAFYGKGADFDAFAVTYNQWGFWAILGSAITPIPFKVITIASGTTGMNIPTFLLACLGARGFRFFLVAGLLWKFGAPIRDFIERWLGLVFAAFCILLIGGFYLVRFL